MKGTVKIVKAVKPILALLCVLVLIIGVVPVLAETADMEKANVSWDLVPDKPVTIYTRFVGLEKYIPVEFVITDFEHIKAMKGKNKLSFHITFTNNFVPTDEEIQIAGLHCSGCYLGYCVNDYTSGLNVEEKNKYDVTVKVSEEVRDKVEYKADDGTKLSFIKKLVYQLTIEYPESYDGLCIGATGRTEASDWEPESEYWEGKLPFSKTVYYSLTNSDLTHFMRIDPSTAIE